MELTKLELKGFKSFGDRTTINFDKGITGIVGPNGCGKSNIVDAIRWVLGEQKTRAIRSDKLENIIFNGTKDRKPTHMAEVSLTFDNTRNVLPTEYSQVTIARKYYRSGESEYLLNGVICRLKDIVNLFMDTGISPESYAIIELKMVDDILNNKDQSRRHLFEEAAGIAKFKKRKRETLKKLDDTDADLERVEDLLFEIDKNLKSLKRQAKQAEKYYKIKEDYKGESVRLAQVTLKEHNSVFEGLKKKIDAENDRRAQLTTRIGEQEAKIEELKKDQILKEKDLASSQKDLNEHVNKIHQHESDKQVKNERLNFLQDKEEGLNEQIDQDKKSNERSWFSIQSLRKENEDSSRTLEEHREKMENLRNDLEDQKTRTGMIQDEVDALGDVLKAKQETVYQISKDLEIREIQQKTIKQELEETASDTSERSASMIEFEKKLSQLREGLGKKQKEFDELKSSEIAHNKTIESTEQTVNVIREELQGVNRKIDALQNEYNLTKSMIDNLEGFPEAIKFLKKESTWGKKIPLLSDVISCPDEYKVTVENFLEPYMNHYVVENAEEAIKAVNILSDAAKGKANFFLLNQFEKFHPSPVKLFDNAFPVSEIVEYDPKYKKLIAYILDNVYIYSGDYNDMPADDDVILISQNGKLTKRKFSISGGSVGLFEGKKIGRIKNLEKLDKDIRKLQKKLTEVENSYNNQLEELENLKKVQYQDKLDSLQDEISKYNEELVSIKTRHEQFSEFLTSADTKKVDILRNLEEIDKDVLKLKPLEETEKKELTELQSKFTSLEDELRMQNNLLEEKTTAFNQENIFFHQQENRVNSIEQEVAFKETAYENSKERIEKNQAELESTKEEIQLLLQTAETSDEDLIRLYEQKAELEAVLNETERKYYKVRGDIDEAEKEERELQRSRESADTILMELQNQISDTRLELNSIKERLSIEFNVDINNISQPDEEITETAEELSARVEKLKTKMETMGPINPMAMEAYQEIQERHEFIMEQKEDLIKAKESLITTIDEIDMVARATFMEAFEKIEMNFIKVFRSLFGEDDQCDLKLTDPSNPLESDVEIIAKPKGKKPLTINQLSGGEKTLTAISLLFAIYLLKPAPFCIFDEVDAPLDDANIDKFNGIVKDFATDSQFIIVTHNKRTMVNTDVIYGITMLEAGVSRVVPVDLRELPVN